MSPCIMPSNADIKGVFSNWLFERSEFPIAAFFVE